MAAGDLIEYVQSGNTAGALDFCNKWLTTNTLYHTTYYPYWVDHRSSIEQSFKIVGILMKKGFIKDTISVKRFIELVNDIAREI